MGLLACAVGAAAIGGHAAAEPAGAPASVPVSSLRVRFPTSCGPAAAQAIDRGVGLLLAEDDARAHAAFQEAAELEPSCAMAHWGVAITAYDPLTELPTDAQLAEGRAAIARAEQATAPTPRERDYVSALSAFYEDEEADPKMRLFAREKGLQELAERYPHDTTATILYAQAELEVAAVTGERALERRRDAAEELRNVLAAEPQNAGATLLLVQVEATPALAASALDTAARFVDAAPRTARAQLAPSAVFALVGQHPDARESARAALAAAPHGGLVSGAELEALDRVVDADLQTGDVAGAERIVNGLSTLHPLATTESAAAALATIPARWMFARRDFAHAAELTLTPAGYPWASHPDAEAPVLLARAIGAARIGDAARAQQAADALDALRDHSPTDLRAPEYVYLDAYADEAAAWASLAAGKADDAVLQMRSAAGEEDAAALRGIGLVPVLPAREQLGDLLVAIGRPAQALSAYEHALRTFPRRYGALAGALQAARATGDAARARSLEQRLGELAPGAPLPSEAL